MKKIFEILLGCAMILSLAACSDNEEIAETSLNESGTQSVTVQNNTSADAGQSDNNIGNSNSLVAYFAYSENMGSTDGMSVDAVSSASLNSRTDNTEGNLQIMAQVIAEQKGADIFHILMTEPYDSDYSTMLPRAIDEMQNEDYPELQNKVENLEQYDVIYLGTPVWNAEIPPALHTFLAENDLSGKKIVLFGIHLGSRLGRMESQITELAPDADLAESFTVTASNANDDVRKEFGDWLAGIDVD